MAEHRLSEINLNLLAALDALLTESNVTRAAARMGITQSAMSHSLRQLREVLDDPILVRGPAGMTPTPRASQLMGPLRRGLSEIRNALVAAPAFDPATAQRDFTLAMSDIFSLQCVPPMLDILAREAPHIDLNVRPSSLGRDADLLEAGELDAALFVALEDRSVLRARKLYSEDFVCVVREGHPDVRGALPLDLYVKLSHALISPRGSGMSFVDTALAQRGLARRIALRVPFGLAAPIIVAQSDLVLTAPRSIAETFVRLAPLRLFDPPIEVRGFSVYLVWHERNDRDPAHMWLRDAMVRATATHARTALQGD